MNWSDILLYESRSDKKKNYDILSEIMRHMLIDYSLIMINDDHKNRENGTTAFKSSDFIDA